MKQVEWFPKQLRTWRQMMDRCGLGPATGRTITWDL